MQTWWVMTGYDDRDSSNVQSLHIWILYHRGCPNGQINTFCPPFDGLYDKCLYREDQPHCPSGVSSSGFIILFILHTFGVIIDTKNNDNANSNYVYYYYRYHIKTSTGNHRGARTGMTSRITDRTNQLNSTAAATSANHRAAVFVAVFPSNCRLLCSLASRWLGS